MEAQHQRATPAGGPLLFFSSRLKCCSPAVASQNFPPGPEPNPSLRHHHIVAAIATTASPRRHQRHRLNRSQTRVPQSPERTRSSARPQDLRQQVPVPSLVQDCKILNKAYSMLSPLLGSSLSSSSSTTDKSKILKSSSCTCETLALLPALGH
jgi:hypothetical protein